MGMPQPWERRKGESQRAFAAFVMYRDLGNERTYATVAEKLQKSEALIGRWGRNHSWQERVEAYDAYLDRRRVEANIRERIRMVDRQAQTAVLIQEKCTEALGTLDGQKLTPMQIARLFEVATKVERSCRGEPKEDQVAAVNIIIEPLKEPTS